MCMKPKKNCCLKLTWTGEITMHLLPRLYTFDDKWFVGL